ncbi:MAG: hypothetical protein ACUVSF_13995 [Anaerolineae bacterium]
MATNLTTLRARVARTLADAGNLAWSTDDLDEGIRKALFDYSLAIPLLRTADITLTQDGRQIDLSSLSNSIQVVDVWLPYDPDETEPRRQPFRHWVAINTLFIEGVYVPRAGDTAHIFYQAYHTLEGLDNATTTTFPDPHANTITLGAAAYCVASRAVDLTDQVTVDRDAVVRLQTWARRAMLDFQDRLKLLSGHGSGVPHIPLPPLDRYDGEWR